MGVDGIVRLERSQTDQASEVLARAFHDDPVYRAALPDAEKRPKRLAWLMAKAVRYSLLYGQVYTTPEVEGVACWLPPGQSHLTVGGILRSGLYALPLRLGFGAYRRLTAIMSYTDAVRRRCVPQAHWYLWVLGVDVHHQRQGLGGRLLQPVLMRAEDAGVACYLETEKERNVRFYERHGFRVTEAGWEPRHGVRTWGLLREGATRDLKNAHADCAVK